MGSIAFSKSLLNEVREPEEHPPPLKQNRPFRRNEGAVVYDLTFARARQFAAVTAARQLVVLSISRLKGEREAFGRGMRVSLHFHPGRCPASKGTARTITRKIITT
jgi:hypothetical protein